MPAILELPQLSPGLVQLLRIERPTLGAARHLKAIRRGPPLDASLPTRCSPDYLPGPCHVAWDLRRPDNDP